jgi:hypothetical protein
VAIGGVFIYMYKSANPSTFNLSSFLSMPVLYELFKKYLMHLVGIFAFIMYAYFIFGDVGVQFNQFLYFISFVIAIGSVYLLMSKFTGTAMSQLIRPLLIMAYTYFFFVTFINVPKKFWDNHYYIVVFIMLLTGYVFYYGSGISADEISIEGERVKSILTVFCLLLVLMVVYMTNPANFIGDTMGMWFYGLILLMAFFGLIYTLLILFVPDDGNTLLNTSLLGKSSLPTSMFVGMELLAVLGGIIYILYQHNIGIRYDSGIMMSSFAMLLAGCAILVSQKKDGLMNAYNLPQSVSKTKQIMKYIFGGLFVGALMIFVGQLITNKFTMKSAYSLVFVLGLVYLFYKIFVIKPAVSKNGMYAETNTPSSFGKSLFYAVQCFFEDWIKLLKGEITTTTPASVLVAILSGLGVYAIFKGYSIRDLINRTDEVIMEETQSLNVKTTMPTPFKATESPEYRYGLSFWFYLDSAGGNATKAYATDATILNIGEKPHVVYNGKQKKLKIMVQQQKDTVPEEVYSSKSITIQKWHHLCVNYVGGTMDVFLDGVLVKTIPNTVPYRTVDSIVIGQDKGLYGGLKHLVYSPNPLTIADIRYKYILG